MILNLKRYIVLPFLFLAMSCGGNSFKVDTVLVPNVPAESEEELTELEQEQPLELGEKPGISWAELKGPLNVDPMEIATTTNQFVLLYFRADESESCKDMDLVFRNEDIAIAVNQTVVPIKLDAAQNAEWYHKYVSPALEDKEMIGVPTIAILSPSFQAIIITGVIPKDELMKLLFAIHIHKQEMDQKDESKESASIFEGLSARR